MKGMKLEFVLNTHEDIDWHGNPISGIKVDDINEGRIPKELFGGREFISYRDLFNNLDGDDRAGIPNDKRYTAGALIQLASICYISGFEDSPEIPEHIRGLINSDPYRCVMDDIECEYDNITNSAYDAICAYLFGRLLVENEDDELRADAYCLITDLLWFFIREFETIVPNAEDIVCILENFTRGYDITAYWYPYHITVSITDENPEMDVSNLLTYLKERGLT